MPTVEFVIPAMEASIEPVHVGNALVGVSGVAAISIDIPAHSVSVEYDAGFVSEELLRATLQASGYPDTRLKVEQ